MTEGGNESFHREVLCSPILSRSHRRRYLQDLDQHIHSQLRVLSNRIYLFTYLHCICCHSLALYSVPVATSYIYRSSSEGKVRSSRLPIKSPFSVSKTESSAQNGLRPSRLRSKRVTSWKHRFIIHPRPTRCLEGSAEIVLDLSELAYLSRVH